MTLMHFFWLCFAVVLYAYIGFPLLLILRGMVWRKVIAAGNVTPSVTLIVVAHNEVGVIRSKLENLLALDYPREFLQIIIASDGSNDGTDEFVAAYVEPRLQLLSLPKQGKIPTLNVAITHAHGDVIVFSDANSIFKPDAIRWLVKPFADKSVGGVAGNQCYVSQRTGAAAIAGEPAFWNFDQFLKRCQSAAGSITSATGAIYAVRRKLIGPVPSGVGDDAFISYQIIAQRKRLVYEPRAIAHETVSPSAEVEFQRKIRICARGLVGLRHAPGLMNPARYGFYSLQLVSHKLLRWSMPWPLSALFVSSLLLIGNGWFYSLTAAAQTFFYGLALLFWLKHQSANGRVMRILSLPFYFCMTNLAFLRAQIIAFQGRRIDSWRATRSEAA